MGTGCETTGPFLCHVHADFVHVDAASPTFLVTDGTQTHNSHNDICYILDPTLAFVGVPYYVTTFSFFDFQAAAVAAVFSGLAKLPSESETRVELSGSCWARISIV